MLLSVFWILYLLFALVFIAWIVKSRHHSKYMCELKEVKPILGGTEPGFVKTPTSEIKYRKESQLWEGNRFLFIWQIKVFWFLVSLASLIVFCTDLFNNIKVAYTSALAFFGLAVTFLFGFIIGNLIYYVVKKIKEIKAEPPTSEGRF